MGLHQFSMIKWIFHIIFFWASSAIEAVQKNGILSHIWISLYDFYWFCHLHNICHPCSLFSDAILYGAILDIPSNDYQTYEEKYSNKEKEAFGIGIAYP